MDDLIALMAAEDDLIQPAAKSDNGEGFHGTTSLLSQEVDVKSKEETREKIRIQASDEAKNPPKHTQTSTIDPFTKIRIVSRQTSRMELVDILSPFTFQTTTVLASLCNISLKNLITHPSNNNEPGAIGGKTQMATMGVVFTNSGSRISKNGRAFSILTLGDLSSGPCVSVLLFGDAYSNYTKKIQPGQVVAVLAPSILPKKKESTGRKSSYKKELNDETSISLSVNERDQLVYIGKALDHGVCLGVNRKQGPEGSSTRCKHFVDLRHGKYCKYHVRQQSRNVMAPSTRKGPDRKKSNLSFVQSLREEANLRRKAPVVNKLNPKVHSTGTLSVVMPRSGAVLSQLARSGFSNSMNPSIPTFQGIQERNKGNNFQIPQNFHLSRVPLHLKKGTPSSATNEESKSLTFVSKSMLSNPYAKSVVTKAKHAKNTKEAPKKKLAIDILGDALSPPPSCLVKRKLKAKTPLVTPSGKENTKRKRNLVHMEGFDGQVQVPKPNALFKRIAQPTRKEPENSDYLHSSVVDEECLLDKQRELSERLKQRKHTIMSKGIVEKPSSSQSPSNFHGLWDNSRLSDRERERLLHAKSNYSIEANAELYVKNRRAVVELEKRENTQLKREARKSKDEKAIVTEYVCHTCYKGFAKKPLQCIRSGHIIKKKREIKKCPKIEEKRLSLNKKSLKEGGLVLGAGLEWSDWRRAP